MFKNKVHDRIDHNILSFTEEKPNVNVNSLLNHGNRPVNVIIKEVGTEVSRLVENVKTSWSSISMSMQKHSALTGVRDDCEVCKTKPERCKKLRDYVQELID